MLQSLLEGRYRDPQSGQAVSVATRSLVIADSLAGREAELVGALDMGKRLAVVSDPQTDAALGARVHGALAERFTIDRIALPAHPHADETTASRVQDASSDADALIAIGSGTINDLTKYASARAGKPYAVFATAPSMNGYVSLTASITVGGHKSTLPAQAPAGAFFDLEVLAAAPKRMIRAGLGDSICRTTAQADWLLSHLLLGTDYRELPFDLLREDEAALLAMAGELTTGSLDAMRTLVRTLVLSGFGTAIVGSSAPASQAEHLVSHYIDMLGPQTEPSVLHGEQIAVTTLSIARLQHAMLGEAPVLHPVNDDDGAIRDRYGAALAHSVLDELDHKRLNRQRVDALNARIAANWNDIRERIGSILLPVSAIEAALKAAGAPMTPADIGLDRAFYDAALLHAREIRNRFTVLDLAASAGKLEPLLAKL